MFGLGFPELILILIIALIIFGPGKLPEVGKAIGKSVREFKKATNEVKREFEIDESPVSSVKKEEKPQEEIKQETAQQTTPKNPYTTVFDEKEKKEEKEVKA